MFYRTESLRCDGCATRNKFDCLTRFKASSLSRPGNTSQAVGRDWFALSSSKTLLVSTLAEHFSPDNGCPTKELYSMAGLANFSMTGLADDGFFGSSVASLSDLDGDGVTDLAVGAN